MSKTLGHGTAGQPSTCPSAEWWGNRPMAYTPKGSKRWAGWYKRQLSKAERRERRAIEAAARLIVMDEAS